MKPILVIEQEYSLRGLGLLGERLDASGVPYRSLRAWEERIEDVEIGDLAAVIPMGGTQHAWEDGRDGTLSSERKLLADAVDSGVPVFGICLGGQLLAHVLGGEVGPADAPERGWVEIAPVNGCQEDPIFGVLERATGVYQWPPQWIAYDTQTFDLEWVDVELKSGVLLVTVDRAGGVDLEMIEPRHEAIDRRVRVGFVVLRQGLVDRAAKRVYRQRPSRDADDTRRVRELFVHVAMKQRGVEFPIGEVAGAAEHDDIERIDLGEFRRHFSLTS